MVKRTVLAMAAAGLCGVFAVAAQGQECVFRAEIRGADRFASEFRRFWKGTQWEGVEDVFQRGVFDWDRAVWEALDRKGTVSFAMYGDGIAEGAHPLVLAAVLPVKDPAPVHAWLEEAMGTNGYRMEELGVRLYEVEDGDGWVATVVSDGRMTVAWSFAEETQAERVMGLELHEAEPIAAEGTFALRVKGSMLGEGTGRALFGDDWRGLEELFPEHMLLRGAAAALAAMVRSEWTEIGMELRGKTVRVDFAAKGDWAQGGGPAVRRGHRVRSKALDGEDVCFAAVDRSGQALRMLETLQNRAAAWAERGGDGGFARILSGAGREKLPECLGGEMGLVELDVAPALSRCALWVERAEGAAELRERVRRHAQTVPEGLLRRLGAGDELSGRMAVQRSGERESGAWSVDAYELSLDGEAVGTLELAWGGGDGPVVASTLGPERLDALLADWSAGRRPGAEAAEGFRKRMKGTSKRAGREYEGFAETVTAVEDAMVVLGALARASGNTEETPWKQEVGEWMAVIGETGEWGPEDEDGQPVGRQELALGDEDGAGVAWRAGRIGGGVFAGAAAIPEATLRRWINNATRGAGSCWLWWEAVWEMPEEPDEEE